MPDLGENPLATMLYAVWDIAKWWLTIAATWFLGLLCGGMISGLCYQYLRWWPWRSSIEDLGYALVIPGVGITLMALCLPMAFDSRRLAIGAAIVNFAIWMFISVCVS